MKLQRRHKIALFFAALFVGALAYGALKGGKPEEPTFVVATPRDLRQEVSVTGNVKPASQVELGFEKSGRVATVQVGVGDKVGGGSLLARLDIGVLAAQLEHERAGVDFAIAQVNQQKANVESEQARLEELQKGTRSEELQLAEIKVRNAQTSLTEERTTLQNVTSKAELDLNNILDALPNTLNDAYAKADDAINKQGDALFTVNGGVYSITFTTSGPEEKAESQRSIMNDLLKRFQELLRTLPSGAEREAALKTAEKYLLDIRAYLLILTDVLNGAGGLSQTTLDTYKGNLTTARANVNTAVSNITDKVQAIASQKATNRDRIVAAQVGVSAAENALAVAEAELELKKSGSNKDAVRAQEARVRQAKASVASSEAQLAQARSNVDRVQADIRQSEVRSPIAGTVTKVDVKTGEIASPNKVVIAVASQAQFEMEAFISEIDVAKIELGDAARVTLDAYGNDASFDAKVTKIDPAETVIEGVTTYKTTFQFVKEDERIRSGMTANIDIATDSRTNVIALPQRAVVTRDGEKFVNVLNEDGTTREVKVKTGLRASDGSIEITEGLSGGEKVIMYTGS